MILMTACGQRALATAPAQGLEILTTTTILADFTRNIVGDKATVGSLLRPGADPHAYQATPQDAVRVSASNVLIENGLEYEHTFQSMLDNDGGERTTIIASDGLTPAEENGEANPHLWVNPRFAIRYVENIRDGLVQADPVNAETYTANAQAYIDQLNELDSWAEQEASALPPEQRVLVTNHDALGYFADRYGFEVIGVIIPSASDETGGTAEQMAKVIDIIKSHAAPAIFLDEVENPRLAQQISDETGAQLIKDLYFESLSSADGPAANYLDMIRHDVTRIVEALKP